MRSMGGSQHDEIERKYDVEAGTVFPNLAEVEGVAHVGQPEELDLEAVYFDTADLDLARHGVTLRRRTGGHDAGWHLKLPRVSDTRTEVHEPLGDAGEQVPDALVAPIRAMVRDRPLQPVVRLATARREYALHDAAGGVIATVCDDQVRAERLDGTGGPGSRDSLVQSWREWELELDQGVEALLDVVEEQLLAAGAAPAASGSKLLRALGDLPPAEPPGSEHAPTGSARALFSAHLAEHTAKLHRQDSAVRAGRPEGIHKLRIAGRRLRSALATWRPQLDGAATEPVRDELRWLGEQLAPARDAQVLREHLAEVLSDQPAELVVGSVAARIDDELGAAYLAGRDRAVEALDGDRYLRLLDALDRLIESPPLTSGSEEAAEQVVKGLLRRDAKRLRRAVRDIDAAGEPGERDVAFHEARKKAKRLRYAGEMARPVLGKKARSLAASAKKVQEALGVHQDSVVARERLRELGMQAHLGGENAFTFGRLHGVEEARAVRAEADFDRAWKRLRRKHLNHWLG
ncbi:CHAD domain containing protein [Intrasporangium calvum DSM 43043]|uniref:CHAD domain containing protein n=2 Tax=Intrasporangium calvum TaxID=53358 RepID=E6SB51_INTC7|nr:CHAD domain containing protein [Intrasporangium calvum DSM 43043]